MTTAASGAIPEAADDQRSLVVSHIDPVDLYEWRDHRTSWREVRITVGLALVALLIAGVIF
jgi:hypothetical protein